MRYRKWPAKKKAEVILEALKGKKDIATICSENQITQAAFYQWRDVFLKNIETVFDDGRKDKKYQRLEQQIEEMKKLIGELTLELKKSDYVE